MGGTPAIELNNIGLQAFRGAYAQVLGPKATKQSLHNVSLQVLRPIVERRVTVPQDVLSEAIHLMGKVNVQILSLPVSARLIGGQEGTIDGKAQLDDERVGALAWTGDSRAHCEDSVLVAKKDTGTISEKVLMLVADGMGGQALGELASQTAAVTLETLFLEDSVFQPAAAVLKANQALCDLISTRPDMTGSGTTIALALIKPLLHKAALVHVGDSRFYLLRAQSRRLHILTRDDSLGNVASGDTGTFPRKGAAARAYYDQANAFVHKNVIMVALGKAELKRENVSLQVVELREGDLLIGASDGLNFLDWDVLEQTLAANWDKAPKDITEALKTALKGIAADNLGLTIYKHHVIPSNKIAAPEPAKERSGATTGIWEADPTVKTAFIEEATRALEIPKELQGRFAQLLDENAEFRELAMQDASLAIQRTEQRDRALSEVTRLTEQVAMMETQARTLNETLRGLQTQLASAADKTPIVQPVVDMQQGVERALAEWQEIKAALETNANKSAAAVESRDLLKQLAQQTRTLIEDQAGKIEAEAVDLMTRLEAEKAAVMGPLKRTVTGLQAKLTPEIKVPLKELVESELADAERMAAETETGLDARLRDSVGAVRARKEQIPFPSLKAHLAQQEAKLRAAESELAQLVKQRTGSLARLASLHERLAAYKATAEAVNRTIVELDAQIDAAKIV